MNKSLETNDDDDGDDGDGPDYHYLYDMQLRTLTKEKRDKLLKDRDDKAEELRVLRRKTPKDLWNEDLDAFVKKYDAWEEAEKAEAQVGDKKKKEKSGFLKGKKQQFSASEVKPSPHGLRVEPKIDPALKKPAAKTKKVKEEDPSQTNLMDAFGLADDDDDQPKSLTERLGMKKKATAAAPKKPRAPKDPDAKPKKPRKTASPSKKKKRNPWSDDSDESDDVSDGIVWDSDADDNDDDDVKETKTAAAPAPRERGPRKPPAGKQTTISSMFGSSKPIEISDASNDSISVNGTSSSQDTHSTSQNGTSQSSAVSASALFATKPTKAAAVTGVKGDKPKKAPAPRKKKAAAVSGSDDEDSPVKPVKKRPVAKSKKPTFESDSDDGTFTKAVAASPKKKPAPKRKKANFSDSDAGSDAGFDSVKVTSNFVPERAGRARKQVKYNFSDDDDASD